jgi:hypothetical protein
MNILKSFGLQLIIIGICAPLLQIILPWWIIAPVAFLVCFWKRTGAFNAFMASFLSVFIVWLILAVRIHIQSNGLLTEKIAFLFPLGGSATALIFLSALMGGLVSGFAGLSGNLAAALIFDKKIKHTDYRSR